MILNCRTVESQQTDEQRHRKANTAQKRRTGDARARLRIMIEEMKALLRPSSADVSVVLFARAGFCCSARRSFKLIETIGPKLAVGLHP